VKIPEQIQLMGQTIDIEWDTQLVHEHDALGLAEYRMRKIKLQPSTEVYPVPRQVIEQAYLHEVVHCIFHALGEDEMRSDEKLVDGIAGLLYQVFKDDSE
jgi:hypothetical protein